MALAYTQWISDGVTATRPISWPYLDKAHVKARVSLEPVTITWDDDFTIRFTPVPPAGAVMEARRETPRETRMVDFSDGSTLTESDLDLAQTQTFYIVQEAIDIAGGTLELLSDGSYGAGGRRIKNVGTAIEPRDAITKEYHDGTFIPQMVDLLNQTVTARNGAGTAWEGASAAHAAAVAARDLALQYRDTTKGYRDEVATWHNNVYYWQQDVSTKSADVTTKAATVNTQAGQVAADRTATQGFRNESEGFKNAAAASAAAAATFDPSSYYSKTISDGRYLAKTGGAIAGDLTVYRPGTPTTGVVFLNQAGTKYLHNDGANYIFPGQGLSIGGSINVSNGTVWASDGNVNGSLWGGWLSTWLSNQLGAKANVNGQWFSGDLAINKANPILTFYWAGVYNGQWWMDGSGNMHWRNGSSGQSHFYITPGGGVWTQQLGDLNSRIEDRAYAWAEAKKNEANTQSNDRVHRVRMVGLGEVGVDGGGGNSDFQPAVVTGGRGTAYGFSVLRYRTLQQHIPSQGGYVNVYVE